LTPFIAPSSRPRGVFNLKDTLRFHGDLRDRIISGKTKVIARQLLLSGIDSLFERASDYEGQDTVCAIHYRDFQMLNLIFDGQQLAGIDISKDRSAPVGHDIA
jgi:hypothetical protein